ncbi:MAG TPA: ferredoxin [Stackebrandtia sp.]|jgi:ferredoxin|uniref:ferredoxin n=1 Tax=Stackebrandtia sp. TaxID=2023065 RepID=UPI002D3CB112|nr:ferredoxin [Stackebrandtia sp.]HZE41718.1 ferredoxin [Stackebrandtia sp.]
MKITVDEEKCCGAGTCVMLAPQVFDQRDDDGIVVLLEPRPAEALRDTMLEAANVCPGAAISVDANA